MTPNLGGELFAALSATTSQNLAAAIGGHTRAETVTALADQFARLISTFHSHFLRKSALYKHPQPASQLFYNIFVRIEERFSIVMPAKAGIPFFLLSINAWPKVKSPHCALFTLYPARN